MAERNTPDTTRAALVITDEAVKVQQLAYSPEAAAVVSSIGRTGIFQAIKEKRLIARKYNRRTVILHTDLQSFLGNLPEASAAA